MTLEKLVSSGTYLLLEARQANAGGGGADGKSQNDELGGHFFLVFFFLVFQ